MLKNKETAFLLDFPSVTSAQWKQKIIRELKGKPFDDLIWHTNEGFEVQPFYSQEDLEKIKIRVPQKQRAGWEIRQDMIVTDLKKANEAARKALEQGAESVGFKLSKIDLTKGNLKKLLSGVNLSNHPVHFSGVRMKSLQAVSSALNPNTSGSVDILDLSLPAIPEIARIAQNFPSFDFITLKAPAFKASVGKSSAEEQIAEVLKLGAAFLKESAKANIPVHKLVPAIRFSISLTSDYFMEIAKLRALRLLWTEQVNQAEKMKHVPVFIHAENTPQKTARGDEHYNLLRATTTAMSAIIGGCDSLSLNAIVIPGKSKSFSERIYRNIQLLLKYESCFDELDDPARGSFYVEILTMKMMESVRKFLT